MGVLESDIATIILGGVGDVMVSECVMYSYVLGSLSFLEIII